MMAQPSTSGLHRVFGGVHAGSLLQTLHTRMGRPNGSAAPSCINLNHNNYRITCPRWKPVEEVRLIGLAQVGRVE